MTLCHFGLLDQARLFLTFETTSKSCLSIEIFDKMIFSIVGSRFSFYEFFFFRIQFQQLTSFLQHPIASIYHHVRSDQQRDVQKCSELVSRCTTPTRLRAYCVSRQQMWYALGIACCQGQDGNFSQTEGKTSCNVSVNYTFSERWFSEFLY